MGAADKPMLPFPQMKGFLGTGATFAADLNLVVQFVMGAALLVGGFWRNKSATQLMGSARRPYSYRIY